MEQTTVLKKTVKGIEELKTRKYNLSQSLRMVLILIDGKSDVAALKKKAISLAELEDYLKDLVTGGYIQDQNNFTASAPAPSTAGKTGNESPTTMAKWQIVDMVRDVVGAEFGERATKRFLEIDDTRKALSTALDQCFEYIELTIDSKKAKTVKQKGTDILKKL